MVSTAAIQTKTLHGYEIEHEHTHNVGYLVINQKSI